MSKSEVVELRHRIELEYDAMTGFAAGTARLNRVGQYQQALAQHIGEEAAMKLVYELYTDAANEQTCAIHDVSKENEND